MKKIYFVLLAALCMSVFTSQAADWYPTTVVQVAPDAGGIPPSEGNGTLRKAISDNGSAIYELQRGGVYFVNGTCGFGANDAVVRAAEGTGPRPIIVPFTATGSSNDVFSSTANIRLENLYVYGFEWGENAPTRRGILRANSGDGTSYEFENCVLEGTSSAAILRFENLNASGTSPFTLTINNCIFRNSVDYSNIGNARAIDFRDSKGITAHIKNSTFYNISAQTIRQGATTVDNFVFENNTVYGSSGAFVIGTAEKASVKNNIFYNPALNGATSETAGLISFTAIEYPREIEILNNLFYRESGFEALTAIAPETRYLAKNALDNIGYDLEEAGEVLVEDTLNYAIDFKNPPASLLPFYTYLWTNGNPTAIPTEEQTFNRRETTAFVGDDLGTIAPYDFSYPKSHPAATAGVGGTYLGAWEPTDGSGINQTVNNNIKCYFDVAAKKLSITLNTVSPILKVSVYTPTGMLIYNELVVPNGEKAECILSGLSGGVYLFSVEIPGGVTASGKFIFKN